MLVLFDGSNGTGKSTVISALADAVAHHGNKDLTIHVHRTPGHRSELSKLLRELLVEQTDPRAPKTEWTRRALYLADAADYWANNRVVCESKDHLVLLDRSHHSTLAYGMFFGLSVVELQALMKVSDMACPMRPDLYIYMTCDLEVCMRRLSARAAKNKDVYLAKASDMHQLAINYDYTLGMLPSSWNMPRTVDTTGLTPGQMVMACKTQIWQSLGIFLETSTAQAPTTT